MSALVKNALVFIPGQGGLSGVGRVFRDGDGVVVIGRIDATKKMSRGGDVEISTDIVVRFKSIDGYNYAKTRAAEKDLTRYAKLVGAWNEDDRAEDAPELPDSLRKAINRRREQGHALFEEAEGASILRLSAGDSLERALEPTPAKSEESLPRVIELLPPGEAA